MPKETYFTDAEYRLLLSALGKEREVCEKVDQDSPGKVCLIKLMNNIERKIRRIQYADTVS